MKNFERRVFHGYLALTLFVLMGPVVLAIAGKMDWESGKWSLIGAALVPSLVPFIAALVHRTKAKMWDELLAGKNLIVHWRYTDEQWKASHEGHISEAWLFLVLGIGLLACSIFLATGVWDIVGKIAAWPFGIVALINLLIFGLGSILIRREAQNTEAWISKDAVLIGGQLYAWNLWGGYLIRALKMGGGHPHLQISYGFDLPRRGVETIEVPIPPGEEERADQILAEYKRQIEAHERKELGW